MKKIALILPWLADFGHGIIIAILVTHFFGISLEPIHLVFALLFSVIPDFDGILLFLKYGNVGSDKDRIHDHRDGLHYPIPFLILGIIIFTIDPFWGTLFTVSVMVHFLNDTWGTGFGLKWFWPISDRSYKFFPRKGFDTDNPKNKFLISWNPKEKVEAIKKFGTLKWLEQIYMRPTIVSSIEYGTFVLGIVLLYMIK